MARNSNQAAETRAAFIKRAKKVVADRERDKRKLAKPSGNIVGAAFQHRNSGEPYAQRVVRVEGIKNGRALFVNVNTGRKGSTLVRRLLEAYKPVEQTQDNATTVQDKAREALANQITLLHPEIKDDVNLYVELLERAIADRDPQSKQGERLEAVVIQTTDAQGNVKGRQVLRVSPDERVGIHMIPAEMANAEVMKGVANNG